MNPLTPPQRTPELNSLLGRPPKDSLTAIIRVEETLSKVIEGVIWVVTCCEQLLLPSNVVLQYGQHQLFVAVHTPKDIDAADSELADEA